jgi:hypothetical protein
MKPMEGFDSGSQSTFLPEGVEQPLKDLNHVVNRAALLINTATAALQMSFSAGWYAATSGGMLLPQSRMHHAVLLGLNCAG